MALVLIVGAAWPFAYRASLFREQREQGRLQAEADWQNGTPRWYLTREEFEALTESQQDKVFNSLNQFNATICFEVRKMWPFWQSEQFEWTYRAVIEEKLKAAGRQPPMF